jgi:hypothetical protein
METEEVFTSGSPRCRRLVNKPPMVEITFSTIGSLNLRATLKIESDQWVMVANGSVPARLPTEECNVLSIGSRNDFVSRTPCTN